MCSGARESSTAGRRTVGHSCCPLSPAQARPKSGKSTVRRGARAEIGPCFHVTHGQAVLGGSLVPSTATVRGNHTKTDRTGPLSQAKQGYEQERLSTGMTQALRPARWVGGGGNQKCGVGMPLDRGGGGGCSLVGESGGWVAPASSCKDVTVTEG